MSNRQKKYANIVNNCQGWSPSVASLMFLRIAMPQILEHGLRRLITLFIVRRISVSLYRSCKIHSISIIATILSNDDWRLIDGNKLSKLTIMECKTCWKAKDYSLALNISNVFDSDKYNTYRQFDCQISSIQQYHSALYNVSIAK